jgi:hypothetical protein
MYTKKKKRSAQKNDRKGSLARFQQKGKTGELQGRGCRVSHHEQQLLKN